MSKPKAIIVLIILFAWSFTNDVLLIFRYEESLDYFLFKLNGEAFFFWVLLCVQTMLDGATVKYLWVPAKVGFLYGLGAIFIGAITNAAGFIFMSADILAAREAYTLSRQARGLPVNLDRIEVMFSSDGLILTMALSGLYVIIVLGLLISKRSYFVSPSQFLSNDSKV